MSFDDINQLAGRKERYELQNRKLFGVLDNCPPAKSLGNDYGALEEEGKQNKIEIGVVIYIFEITLVNIFQAIGQEDYCD